MLDNLFRGVHYAVRSLGRSPGFTVVAVLTLALAIGANAALFSVLDGVVLRPLPYPEPDRLVRLWPEAGLPHGGVDILSEQSASYRALGGYGWEVPRTLTGQGEPERLAGADVTPGLFTALGVDAVIGRTFAAGEDRPDAERVVLLSHGLWQRRFGADPAVVGRTLTLDGVARTVVGVMPASFRFPSRETELWVPALGGVAAVAATRALSGMLYGVGPADPVTFGAVALVLVLVALAASYLPARRAARVDPMVAMRAE